MMYNTSLNARKYPKGYSSGSKAVGSVCITKKEEKRCKTIRNT
jgi:hypothetical protein